MCPWRARSRPGPCAGVSGARHCARWGRSICGRRGQGVPRSEVVMEFVIIDNCPVPKQLADEVLQIKKLSGAHLNSCDRSTDAEPLLAKFGKMSQRQLYEGFRAGKPGFNPANPPGFS